MTVTVTSYKQRRVCLSAYLPVLCQPHEHFGGRPTEPAEMKPGVKISWDTSVLCTSSTCLCQCHEWLGSQPAEPAEMKPGVKISWDTSVLCTSSICLCQCHAWLGSQPVKPAAIKLVWRLPGTQASFVHLVHVRVNAMNDLVVDPPNPLRWNFVWRFLGTQVSSVHLVPVWMNDWFSGWPLNQPI